MNKQKTKHVNKLTKDVKNDYCLTPQVTATLAAITAPIKYSSTMEAYILYLANLLAALVLPATAQTGSTGTKAAPGYSAIPYRLTINTIGDNKGKASFKNKNNKGGIVIIDNTPHAYGNQDPSKTTTVALTVSPNKGYALDDDYPKAYKTGDPTTVVKIETDGTFKMPTYPVTIDVKYNKADDLDLGLATLAGKEVSLTYDGSKGTWTYKPGTDATPIPFTGNLKGKGTCNLKITLINGRHVFRIPTLANGTELTGNIEVDTSQGNGLSLNVEEAGTATVKGNITITSGYINLNRGRLNIYGEVKRNGNSEIFNLMQWRWKEAPTKEVTIITSLEQVLTTFTADGSTNAFATSIRYVQNSPVKVKVKVDNKIQKDSKGKTTFVMNNSLIAPLTGMEDSELKPVEETSNSITITGETTYKPSIDGSGTEANFSGTITGDVSTIKVDATVTNDPTIILKDIKKKDGKDNTVEVADQAKVTLALKGTANEISTMNVAAGGTLTLATVADGASFAKDTPPTIINKGTFISETRLIRNVGGDAPLEVTADPVSKAIAKGEEYILTVEASIPAPATSKAMTRGTTPTTLSYSWEEYSPYGWYEINDSLTCATTEAGIYRCKVTSTNGDATTTLYTQTAEVTLKGDPAPEPEPTPDPSPTPVLYTVTLPTLVGATTDPAAGTYNVEGQGSLVFALTPCKDYDQSKPVVKTSRGETITPRAADGKYEVTIVRENITIAITGIKKNNPTGNAIVEAGIRIWATPGTLCLRTDNPADVQVYTFSGQLAASFHTPGGDAQQILEAGIYIAVIGTKSYKVKIT